MVNPQQTDTLPKIIADCFVPLGPACRPARWLKKYRLRYCSLPFDWFLIDSLETILSFIIYENSSFFQEYEENVKLMTNEKRYVVDTKNHILSVHDFPANKEVGEYLPLVREKFERRCNRLKKILKNYNKICFVCNRGEDVSIFLNFLLKIHETYPHLTINFVNVRNSEEHKIMFYEPEDNICLYDIYANDIHEKGKDKESNPKFWVGNESLWNEVCSKFFLSKNKKFLIIENKFLYFFAKFRAFRNKFMR